MNVRTIILAASLAVAATAASAGPLTVSLKPAASNPAAPRMGDRMAFQSVIRNTGAAKIDGVIAWLSLVQIDQGREQPVDLEDWSAHKAITKDALLSGASVETVWPMRLIQPGRYRVVVSAVSRNGVELTPSPFVDFTVRAKPIIESARAVPVAFGVPLIVAAGFLFAWRRKAR